MITAIALRVIALFAAARSRCQAQTELALEKLALRQQLALFTHQRPTPRFHHIDRLFWVWLRRGRRNGAPCPGHG